MAREYRHIKMYEKEILELRVQGLSQRQIGEQLGLTYKQIKDFFRRYNRNQRKISSGEELKHRGRPRKNETGLPPSIQQLSVLAQTRYELESYKRHNKQLQMENELLRDFLSLTERK